MGAVNICGGIWLMRPQQGESSTRLTGFRTEQPGLAFVNDGYDGSSAFVAHEIAISPSYVSYLNSVEHRIASVGVWLPGMPAMPLAEQAADLERQIARAEAAENFSLAARLRSEFDGL